MTDFLKEKWRGMGLRWRMGMAGGIAAASVVVCLVLADPPVDTDGDGMSDWYEEFFGLNPTNAADGSVDSDGEGVVNSNECLLGTDPFAVDTDRDGWNDGVDSNPVSRAWVDWGNDFFTRGDTNLYAWPLWMAGAVKIGGEWQTNSPTAWHVPASETNEAGLLMDVDRGILTNDLRMRLTYFDHTNASLYVDLWDVGAAIATNLFGNLLTGSNDARQAILNIPFETYTNAIGIYLRRGDGEITVYDCLLYVDKDGDGLDADQEAQIGTSDSNADSDGDGLSDYAEAFTHGTSPTNADTDGDGLSDGAEVNTYGTNPNLVDSDGDGIGDGMEVKFGQSPTSSNTYATLPFQEFFETNTVSLGILDGQNDWQVSPTGGAVVQTGTVCEGSQALAVDSATNVTVRHLFASSATNVWLDFHTKVASSMAPTGAVEGSYAFLVNNSGKVQVYNGHSNAWVVLNHSPTGPWARFTLKLDYPAQEWMLILDGAKIAENIGFASAANAFTVFDMEAKCAWLDRLSISTAIPEDLSLDSDNLPDAWELARFGNLSQTDSGDPDSDGLTNLQEYQLGTDPTAADSDGDGVEDGLEQSFGFDPVVSNSFAQLPFSEDFETNTVSLGLLHGQNGWQCDPTNRAVVSTNQVYEGAQAVEATQGDPAILHHMFSSADAANVWLDFHAKAIRRFSQPQAPEGSFAFYFNADGLVEAYDGHQSNWVALSSFGPVQDGEWVRLCVRLDYTTKEWLISLNAQPVVSHLGFARPVSRFMAFEMEAAEAALDRFRATTGLPESADSDGDGLSDFEETALHGTDPELADSDGDGAGDGAEVAAGTDPLVADQGSDPGGPVVTVISPKPNQVIFW